MADHKLMIECADANAEYLRPENGVVYFRCKETGKTLNLYAISVSPENIQLALKSVREPEVKDFEPLLAASLE